MAVRLSLSSWRAAAVSRRLASGDGGGAELMRLSRHVARPDPHSRSRTASRGCLFPYPRRPAGYHRRMPIHLIAIKFTLIFFALCGVAFALGRATMAAGRAAKILCGLPGGDRDQQSEAAISDNQRNAVAAGPAISAVPFHETADGRAVALLNERERGLLARIAMRVHFRRGATIYREGDPADFVYNIAAGVVKAFRTLTDGRQRIVAFLFAEDLIGLAEEGVYVNQAEAVTAVTAYRIPLRALDNLARTDPTLDYSLLLKLTHELRAAQCHALILARHD